MRKYQSCQFWDVWIAIDYSMFQLNAFVTFSCCFFLTKTHISVKKILLKSIKEGKNPWFFHDTSFIFTRRNSHERIQNKFLTKIYSGKCWHILSFGSHSEKLAQFFNVIIWTISSHLHKISVDFFGLVLKPDKLEGAS